MYPDSRELLGPASSIDLSVEKVGHRIVVERHGARSAFLADELDIVDTQ
jgi:hypothetical protein